MNQATFNFDGTYCRVYRYGFLCGVFASKIDAIAQCAQLNVQPTYHSDYYLAYPSNDGTGAPEVVLR